MPTPKDAGHQEKQLELHRSNVRFYPHQIASHGGKTKVNPNTLNDLDESRDQIKRCKEILRGWGVAVEDLPDDEEYNTPLPNSLTRETNSHEKSHHISTTQTITSSRRHWYIYRTFLLICNVFVASVFYAYYPQNTENTTANSGKSKHVDNFQDIRPEDTEYLLRQTKEVTKTINHGLLHVESTSRTGEHFYRTKMNFKNFHSIIHLSNISGQDSSISTNFRITEDAWGIFKSYGFAVGISGSRKGQYYINSVSRDTYQRIKEGTTPIERVTKLEVKCIDKDCSFIVNDIHVQTISGFSNNIDGIIMFEVIGNSQFDITKIEVYEL